MHEEMFIINLFEMNGMIYFHQTKIYNIYNTVLKYIESLFQMGETLILHVYCYFPLIQQFIIQVL